MNELGTPSASWQYGTPLRWPTMAAPSPVFVQLPHVMSLSGGNAWPSADEPVRMSCWFTTKSRQGMRRPFSDRLDLDVNLVDTECSSSTFAASAQC